MRNTHIHTGESLRERRLCGFAEPEPGWMDRLHGGVQHGVDLLVHGFGILATEAAKFVADIPIGILKGIVATAKDYLPTKEHVLSFLNRTADFLRGMVGLKSQLELIGESVDFKTLENMIDYRQWMDAFKTDVLKNALIEPIDAHPFGPLKFLKSLPVEVRQQIYVEFVHKYVPQSVRQDHRDIFGNTPADTNVVLSNTDTVNTAMESMFGITGPLEKGVAHDIAKASLSEHYKSPGATGKDRQALNEDFKHAREYQRLHHGELRPVTVETLKQDLPSSILKGALQYNVIEAPTVKALAEQLRNEQTDLKKVTKQAAEGLSELSGAKQAEVREQTHDIMETFNGLPLWQKGVVVAGIFWLLKSILGKKEGDETSWFGRLGRTLTVGGAALFGLWYFDRKMRGDPAPMKTFSRYVYKPSSDYIKEKTEGLLGKDKENITGLLSIESRARYMTEFLSRDERDGLEREAIGCGLLSDIPLKDLVANFDMTSGNIHDWRLNVEQGSQLDRVLGKQFKANGWKGNYREFFDNAENVKQISESIIFVLYTRGMLNPANLQDVQVVEKEKRRLTADEGYLALRNGDDLALERLKRVVIDGADALRGDPMTLGQFVVESVGSNLDEVGSEYSTVYVKSVDPALSATMPAAAVSTAPASASATMPASATTGVVAGAATVHSVEMTSKMTTDAPTSSAPATAPHAPGVSNIPSSANSASVAPASSPATAPSSAPSASAGNATNTIDTPAANPATTAGTSSAINNVQATSPNAAVNSAGSAAKAPSANSSGAAQADLKAKE